MDGARLATLVQRGYRIAGQKLGSSYALYRPTSKSQPISTLSYVANIDAVFDRVAQFPYSAPPKHGEPARYALVSGLDVHHGDYLVGAEGTLFVGDPGEIHATVCFQCNATLALRRVAPPSAVGLVGYRALATEEVALLQHWPASVLWRGRGAGSEADLPGGVPTGEWMILLPKLACDVRPHNDDVLMDACSARRFAVLAAEDSALGWRISARTLAAG